MTVGGVREWRRSGGTRRYFLEDCGLNYVVGLMFYGDRKRLHLGHGTRLQIFCGEEYRQTYLRSGL